MADDEDFYADRIYLGRPEDIGILLSEKHPETDPLAVRFTDLHKLVTELPEFKDDPEEVHGGQAGSHPDGVAFGVFGPHAGLKQTSPAKAALPADFVGTTEVVPFASQNSNNLGEQLESAASPKFEPHFFRIELFSNQNLYEASSSNSISANQIFQLTTDPDYLAASSESAIIFLQNVERLLLLTLN